MRDDALYELQSQAVFLEAVLGGLEVLENQLNEKDGQLRELAAEAMPAIIEDARRRAARITEEISRLSDGRAA